MGRKQRQASRKARSRADAKPGRAKKDRPDVDLVRRSGFEMQDEALEQALLSGEQAPLIESYFGEKEHQELRDLARQASSRSLRGGQVLFEFVQDPPPPPVDPARQTFRSVAVTGGALTDWFAPHDVHVYRFRR